MTNMMMTNNLSEFREAITLNQNASVLIAKNNRAGLYPEDGAVQREEVIGAVHQVNQVIYRTMIFECEWMCMFE